MTLRSLLNNDRAISEPVTGRFVVPPGELDDDDRWQRHARTNLRFQWGGDTAGQGWGINPTFGGMRIYEAMRQREPLFFIHSGDNIYADGPIAGSVVAEQGQIWNNIVTPQVIKVAETLDEFRGRYRYNLLDDNVRRFNAEVPQIWQWDDHEVTNNWSDAKDLSADVRYAEKNVPLLIARGTRAFLEYAPMRPFDARESQRVYRRYGLQPAARRVRARHALVPRPQFGQLADDVQRSDGVPRPRTVRLAEGRSQEFAGSVEGGRGRHASGLERRRWAHGGGLTTLGGDRQRRTGRREGA
jgi:hypothetical protein